MASTLTTVSAIERELSRLRFADSGSRLRTSVMTHIAWVPEEWVEMTREEREAWVSAALEQMWLDIGGELPAEGAEKD